jgi:4-alpha-glucanotransferase
MASPDTDLLNSLCALFRIDTEYYDIWGNHHLTPRETKLAILASFGLDTSDPDSLERSAHARLDLLWSSPLDPVSVLSSTCVRPAVTLRAPALYLDGHVAAALYYEDGTSATFWHEIKHLRESARRLGRSGSWVAYELELPTNLPLGYHDLEIVLSAPMQPDLRAAQRVISTPDRAWLPERLEQGGKLAGLAISLYGVRSARNWGAGDFTDLAAITDWAASSLGISFLALNPLHAIHNRQPYNTSPYLPLSSFYRNLLYIDIEALEEYADSPSTQRFVHSEQTQREIEALRESEFVEYERVARLKMVALRLLFRSFLKRQHADPPGAKLFRKWAAEEGDLLDRFATYCALDESLHRRDPNLWIWPDWPSDFRDPDSPTVQEFSKRNWRLVLFYKWTQWLIDRQLGAAQRAAQLAGMPIGLYHDLALATDRCGSDLWAYRPYFVEGCRVGSPPDDFAPEGQDWSFPPPNTEAQRANGYRLFIETIRKNSRDGGALRIDHVMRFFRLFWIPDGMPAKQGTYVNEPWEDLLRILALESRRGRFLIVGEDLGTVPPALRDGMERFGMLNYKLFYFEKGPDGTPRPPTHYSRQSLVSSTTHDLPTLAGYWAGKDIDARRDAGIITDTSFYDRQRRERIDEKRKILEALTREGFLPQDFPREAADWNELTGELHNAIIGYLVSTPSMLMLLNEEDLTKELAQQNLPGTTWQYPNWRRKMAYTLEELQGPRADGFVRMFRAWLERAGRISA